tara:strand:+ start:1686 stop:2657 length:972 start_codon:yes stop_codon:yes gene_type:complete
MVNWRSALFLLFFIVPCLVIKGHLSTAAAQKKVVVSIAQIGEPLAEIANGHLQVITLMEQGVDPHLYRLTRSDIVKLNNADLIVYNGLHLEAQLVVPLSRFSIYKPVVAVGDSLVGKGLLDWNGKAYDPHIWMDPQLWISALTVGVEALAKLDPSKATTYRTNALIYFSKLNNLNERTHEAVSTIPKQSRTLITAHDAFGYFGRAYGIDVQGVQGISTESEAGIRKIEFLVDTLVRRRIAAVFIETTVSERNIKALIEGAAARNHYVKIGGTLFSDSMGLKGTPTGTYVGMFEHNVNTIVQALGGKLPNQIVTKPTVGKVARK